MMLDMQFTPQELDELETQLRYSYHTDHTVDRPGCVLCRIFKHLSGE